MAMLTAIATGASSSAQLALSTVRETSPPSPRAISAAKRRSRRTNRMRSSGAASSPSNGS
jgi:hypothetical protein